MLRMLLEKEKNENIPLAEFEDVTKRLEETQNENFELQHIIRDLK